MLWDIIWISIVIIGIALGSITVMITIAGGKRKCKK